MPRFPIILSAALASSLMSLAADDRVIFNRDVRPILGEYCFHCHGPDPGSRKEGIRFDREEGFFAKRDDAEPTVVKGQPEKSPLYQRITATDPDDVMPPPKEHKKLKPAEIAILKKSQPRRVRIPSARGCCRRCSAATASMSGIRPVRAADPTAIPED